MRQKENGGGGISLLALSGGVVVLGFAALFVKWANAPGSVTALYRMLVGSALIAPFAVARTRPRGRPLPRRGVLMALMGGALFGCDMAIWMTAVGMSGTAMPTLMANTAPVWVGLGSLLVLKERQNAVFWVGLAVAVSGVVLSVARDIGGASQSATGILLGLVASFFYASFQMVTQEGRKHLNTLSYLWISTLGAAATLLLVNLALGRPLGGFDRQTYLSFLALGAVVQFLGWLLINYAQGHIKASVVAPTLLGQPILTAIFATLILHETLTAWHLLGGATVLAGIYIVTRSRHLMRDIAP